MASAVKGINPEILEWARLQAGFSLAEVGEKLSKNADVIQSWELGQDSPTYVQLEKLAYEVYKRPLAVFFFPKPPQEPDLKQSFRTFPDTESIEADTRYAIRQGRAIQLSLKELNNDVNPSPKKIFRDIRFSDSTGANELAILVRNYLGVLVEQQLKWRSNEEALKQWRSIIEEHGIFVFKRSFKQKEISGFCLYDKEFPIICLNNTTKGKARQIFTLFHELAHILLGISDVITESAQEAEVVNKLPSDVRKIEVFCNRFAAEFLVPSDDFDNFIRHNEINDAEIESLSKRYKVSRQVILIRLLEKRAIDESFYNRKVKQYQEEAESNGNGNGKGGGDYYANQAAYLGDKYLGLVFSKYYKGELGIEQVADYLNIKAQSVSGLEEIWLRRAAV
jgi:Zn-dependent peptidase ImmA (M78 family)